MSMTTGQNELDTTTALQKRVAEVEKKISSLQTENKALIAVVKEMKTDLTSLQVKENLTRTLITSYIAAQKQADEAILYNIRNISLKVDDRLLSLENRENVMKNMSNSGRWISELEKENGQMEPKSNLRDAQDSEMEKTLKNHTSEIDALKKQLFDIQNSCADDPPSPLNGKVVNFESWNGSSVRYECDRNFVIIKNSTVNCVSRRWKGHPPTCSFLDTTFYAEAAYNHSWYVECYSDSNGYKIQFSRAVDTGTGGGIHNKAEFSTSVRSAKMTLAKVDWTNYYGAYRCGFTAEEGSADIIVPLQADGALYFPNPSLMASVQDTVSLRLRSSEPSPRILWSLNGSRVQSWDGLKEVLIEKASEEDAGIYHARYENDYSRALLRLVVRRCKSNLYGEGCDLTCPPCHNGGICHDLFGVCVCPEGFVGENCEKPCKEGFHGADCARQCARENCKFRLFCKPNPYGCACARGFKGKWCNEECEPGTYGADCKQPCHCAGGSRPCNRFTGTCSGGCATGWRGESCQIRDD